MQGSTEHSIFYGSFFLGSFPRVLYNLLCHGLLCDSTYMWLVEVETPLHSVLVVGSYGTLLVSCLTQILLSLILHLCIHLDLLTVCCTEVLGYIAQGYTVVVHYCIAVEHFYNNDAHFCMAVVPG
jgi:hypothetical protein